MDPVIGQALGLRRRGELGGVGGGQVPQRGADHVQRLADTAKSRGRAHLGHLPYRDWSLLAAVLVPGGQASRI